MCAHCEDADDLMVVLMQLCVFLYFHPSIHPSMLAAILSSVKSNVNLCFPFMFTSKMDTQTHAQMYNPSHFNQHKHTHTHTGMHAHTHPFSSPSDELLSCLLGIGSMQPQSCPAANHRTMRRTLTSQACSAFASDHFNRQPSENPGGRWLEGAWRAGHPWKSKKTREAQIGNTNERRDTHSILLLNYEFIS